MNIQAPIDQQIDARNRRVMVTCCRVLPDGKILKVKKGFIHDGSSKPRWSWSVVGSPYTGLDAPCSFWHDVLCRTQIVTKETADYFYLADMRDNGVSETQQQENYYAVTNFGQDAWDENSKNINKARKFIELYEKKGNKYEKVQLEVNSTTDSAA